jgi:flagellar biosynthesis/type III secretory pathway M-ring protein FliF/YscJ
VLADRQSPGGEQVLASVAQAVPAPGLPRPNAVQNRLAELVEQDEKQVAEILKLWMVKT